MNFIRGTYLILIIFSILLSNKEGLDIKNNSIKSHNEPFTV